MSVLATAVSDPAPVLSAAEVSGSLSLKEYRIISGEYWTRRFFLLKGSLLFYYTDRAAFTEVGVLELEGCAIVEVYCMYVENYLYM